MAVQAVIVRKCQSRRTRETLSARRAVGVEDGWNSEKGCGMALTWPLALHLGFISARVEVRQLRGALIFRRGPFALHPTRANGKQRCKNLQAYHVASVHAVGGLYFGKENAVAVEKQIVQLIPRLVVKVFCGCQSQENKRSLYPILPHKWTRFSFPC